MKKLSIAAIAGATSMMLLAGAHGESISYAFKNAVWHIVEQGFGGVVIGFVYGKFHE